MLNKRQKAAAPRKATALNKIKLSKAYQSLSPDEREKAVQKIAKRRADMPPVHRANYDLAKSGKSKTAAIKANCLECCQWQKEEIRRCTSLACHFYDYRPYSNPKDNDNQHGLKPESTNLDEEEIG